MSSTVPAVGKTDASLHATKVHLSHLDKPAANSTTLNVLNADRKFSLTSTSSGITNYITCPQQRLLAVQSLTPSRAA